MRSSPGRAHEITLCKGAYAEPPAVAYQDRTRIDEAYLRCLRILMACNGYPLVASHHPTIIDAAAVMAAKLDRAPGAGSITLYGIRSVEQCRLAATGATGATVCVYIPYGTEWYAYLVRRLAERPANLGFFLRALARR